MAKIKNFGSGIQRMLESAEEIAVSNERKSVEKEVEVTINFKIPKSLHTALKIHAAQNDITIKDLAIKLFTEEVNS